MSTRLAKMYVVKTNVTSKNSPPTTNKQPRVNAVGGSACRVQAGGRMVRTPGVSARMHPSDSALTLAYPEQHQCKCWSQALTSVSTLQQEAAAK